MYKGSNEQKGKLDCFVFDSLVVRPLDFVYLLHISYVIQSLT